MTENPPINSEKSEGRITRSEFADADGDETHDPVRHVGHSYVADTEPHQTDDSESRATRPDFQRVDTAYREWARNRADVDRLRQLHDVIGHCLRDDVGASPQAAKTPGT
jgi:hypothetical protein